MLIESLQWLWPLDLSSSSQMLCNMFVNLHALGNWTPLQTLKKKRVQDTPGIERVCRVTGQLAQSLCTCRGSFNAVGNSSESFFLKYFWANLSYKILADGIAWWFDCHCRQITMSEKHCLEYRIALTGCSRGNTVIFFATLMCAWVLEMSARVSWFH